MFEKEIILEEQLAARCLSSVARSDNCRPTGSAVLRSHIAADDTADRVLNPELERWMYKRSGAKASEIKASTDNPVY